jgi:hypothetical protein
VGAFLLARYLVRDLVVHYVSKKWPKWDLIDHMLARSSSCVLPLGSHWLGRYLIPDGGGLHPRH